MSYTMEEERYLVSLGMQKMGGSFVRYLGMALQKADMTNTHLIKRTWPNYWQEYLEWGEQLYGNHLTKKEVE